MLETDAERMSFTRNILQELSQQSGGPWKEVRCEPHPQYNEMVFWVLLYEDSELKDTHKAFCDILMRHLEPMKPLEAQIAYQKYTDEGFFLVERMKGNEGAFAALRKETLGRYPVLLDGMTGVFRSTDSKR